MKRYIVSVVNKNGKSELGFSNMWMDGDDLEVLKEIALQDVSESTGIPIDCLEISIKEKV